MVAPEGRGHLTDTITRPSITANSQLLLGVLLGAVGRDHEMYSIVDYDSGSAIATLENRSTGNQYELTVRQISGTQFTALG